MSHFVPVYLLTPYLVGQCTFDVLDTILNYLRKFFINICYTYPTKLFVELLKKKKIFGTLYPLNSLATILQNYLWTISLCFGILCIP